MGDIKLRQPVPPIGTADNHFNDFWDDDAADWFHSQALPLVELVVGAEAIDAMLDRICVEATWEADAFIIGRDISAERSSAARERNSQMYARGVKSRAIYLTKFRDEPAILEHVMWGIGCNDEVSAYTAPGLVAEHDFG